LNKESQPTKTEQEPMFKTDEEYEQLDPFHTCHPEDLGIGSAFYRNGLLCIKVDEKHYYQLKPSNKKATKMAFIDEMVSIQPVNLKWSFAKKEDWLREHPDSEEDK
jgi:hypothetical protein